MGHVGDRGDDARLVAILAGDDRRGSADRAGNRHADWRFYHPCFPAGRAAAVCPGILLCVWQVGPAVFPDGWGVATGGWLACVGGRLLRSGPGPGAAYTPPS